MRTKGALGKKTIQKIVAFDNVKRRMTGQLVGEGLAPSSEAERQIFEFAKRSLSKIPPEEQAMELEIRRTARDLFSRNGRLPNSASPTSVLFAESVRDSAIGSHFLRGRPRKYAPLAAVANRPRTIITNLDPCIVDKIDRLAVAEDRSRSKMIGILVREALEMREAQHASVREMTPAQLMTKGLCPECGTNLIGLDVDRHRDMHWPHREQLGTANAKAHIRYRMLTEYAKVHQGSGALA